MSEKWLEYFPLAYRALVEEAAMAKEACCCLCGSLGLVRCQQCGSRAFYCVECAISAHGRMNYHHYLEVWKETDCCFVPLSVPMPIVKTHACENNSHERAVTCFNVEGPPRKLCVCFCQCEPDVVTLTRLRYWPRTLALLDWLHILLLECQVPVSDFSSALTSLITTKYDKMPCNVYPVLIESFEEYRSMKNRLNQLHGICDYGDFMKCPACPTEEGSLLTISIDGNFGLCRKKSSGKSVYNPKLENSMFLNQKAVDTYVESYSPNAKGSDACHNFLAGHMLRSNSRYSALDETGVMGAACRHEHPVPCFVDLRHGERIAYPVYVCEQMKQLYPNSKIQLMYDIACNLEKHLTSNKRSDLLEKFEFAVPVFHAYGHESACQIKYNPRNMTGFGLSDGEVVERLWSYLRRFAAMTKEMHPSHRTNVLNDALVYYGQKSASKLCKLLPKRLERAKKVKGEYSQQFQYLLYTSPEFVSQEDVLQWAEKEKEELSLTTRNSNDIASLKSMARERWFLLRLKSKYSAGQKIANRLSRRINVVSKSLRSAIQKYNSQRPVSQVVTWEGITQLGADQLGGTIQYKAVRLSHSVARANEEEFRVLAEMRNTIQHYLKKISLLQMAIETHRLDESAYCRGEHCLLVAKERYCVAEMTRLCIFNKFGEFPELHQFVDNMASSLNPGDGDHFSCAFDMHEQNHADLEEASDIHANVFEYEEDESSEDEYSVSYPSVSNPSPHSICDDHYCSGYQFEELSEIDKASKKAMESSSRGSVEELMRASGHSSRRKREHLRISSTKDPVRSESCESEEEMEVQTWRKEKLVREEYIRTTWEPPKLGSEELALLYKLNTSASGAFGSSLSCSTEGFPQKSALRLQGLAKSLSVAAAKMRLNRQSLKSPTL